MNRGKVILLLAATAIVGTTLFGIVTLRGSSADSLTLVGISAGRLKDASGVELEAPGTEDKPAITETQAREVALDRQAEGAGVREVTLARAYNAGDLIQDGQLVWVVNFDPDTIPFSGSFESAARDIGVAISLTYIDAINGEWLMSFEQADSELPPLSD